MKVMKVMKVIWLFLLMMLSLNVWGERRCEVTAKVGLAAEWPPLVIYQGQHTTGLDVEIARLVFNDAAICLEFKRLPSSARSLTEMEKGEIDLALMTSFTEERAKYGEFSIPYRLEKMRLFTSHAALSDTSLSQALERGYNIGVSIGSYYGEEFEAIRGGEYQTAVVEVASAKRRAQLLMLGRLDLIIEDEITGRYLFAQSKKPIFMSDYPVHDNGVHFIWRKGFFTVEQIAAINTAIVARKTAIASLLAQYQSGKL
ncbi:substrate-binding periplasmic protein [Pseudoalteromonas fenneropenaei]|uniref:Substrate-binding periplasmic protein n=1 Tax=Pseudoalteromonas fenneropenaei TaxID=1737459 RepID=A0ABV7CGB7_9GAMM